MRTVKLLDVRITKFRISIVASLFAYDTCEDIKKRRKEMECMTWYNASATASVKLNLCISMYLSILYSFLHLDEFSLPVGRRMVDNNFRKLKPQNNPNKIPTFLQHKVENKYLCGYIYACNHTLYLVMNNVCVNSGGITARTPRC